MKKIRVREHWQEIIVRFTDVEVVDEDDNIIESHNVYKEEIEVTESGDNRILTESEAITTCNNQSKLFGKIMEVGISLQNELEFEEDCTCNQYPEYPGLNQSAITFIHSKEFSWRLSIYKADTAIVPGYQIELIIKIIKATEDGKFEYSCVMYPTEKTNYVFPELLKKGKKFKVIM